ncbi:TIGR03086 family metal-binding protein [Cryptosporangium sp. NPDC051539]|uniref:TIGR03086 family metal-binding protein n=1 Tax=Cryptosporangium sp. NPDC051539 TaxID=3363962 RepID=UPI0037AB8F75
MSDYAEGLIERFVAAGADFERRLRAIGPGQWEWPTPCAEWDVRALVNHMTRGNLNYVALVRGGTAAEFVRLRDADALGADPPAAFARSACACAAAFASPGALRRPVDHPLGRVAGEQILAVRTLDSVIHTWDLARALSADETLDPAQVRWAQRYLPDIYAGLGDLDRFFAPPGTAPPGASAQDVLLHRAGRHPNGAAPAPR